MTDFNELWKPIIGFEDRYLISNHARVKSILDCYRRRVDRIKKPSLCKGGYVRVVLWAEHKGYLRLMHCLVAESFLGPRPDGTQVNHIDGNKTNNFPNNLEYVTPKENCAHALRTGLMPVGESSGQSKLKAEEVIAIRKLSPTLTYKEIARLFNVSPNAIRCVVVRKTWSHVA